MRYELDEQGRLTVHTCGETANHIVSTYPEDTPTRRGVVKKIVIYLKCSITASIDVPTDDLHPGQEHRAASGQTWKVISSMATG